MRSKCSHVGLRSADSGLEREVELRTESQFKMNVTDMSQHLFDSYGVQICPEYSEYYLAIDAPLIALK